MGNITTLPEIGTLIYYKNAMTGKKKYCLLKNITSNGSIEYAALFGNWSYDKKAVLQNEVTDNYGLMRALNCYIETIKKWDDLL